MSGFLKKNERLVEAGFAPLRAPDGTPLEAVPQYMIVTAAEADPAAVVSLPKNERLVMVGTVHTERAAAEARYAAALAGSKERKADGKPLYIREAAENIDKKTGLSMTELKACEDIIEDMVTAFAMVIRKEEENT